MSKQDVLNAFQPATGVEFADFVDADPPPRELTPIMRRYLRRKPRNGWSILVWLFLIGAVPVAIIVPRVDTIAWAVAMVALLVWLHLRVRAKRQTLRKILIEGTQRPARVAHADTTTYRSGLIPVGQRQRVILDVDGQRLAHQSFDGSLADLHAGAWLRVLVHRDAPGEVVPVISVS